MRQVNFNLNGLIQNIKINVGKKDEEAVEAIVEKAVEQAIAGSLRDKDAMLDTVEFHTKKDEVIVDSVSVIQPVQTSVVVNIDDDRNIFAGQDAADTVKLQNRNVVFGSLVTKKVPASTPAENADKTGSIDRGGANPFHIGTDFNTLVEEWNNFLDSLSGMSEEDAYNAKLNYMDNIIYAAEQNVNAYLAEHPELDLDSHPPYPLPDDDEIWQGYWALKDKASTWRCYRFMMINNNVREQFRAYSIQYEYGLIDFDEIQFGNVLATGTYPDIADFEEFSYLGGHSEGTESGPGYYVPNENNDLRYIYSMAMLTVYVTKANAAQLRLRDEHLSTQSRNILQRNLAYFRAMIANIQTALAEIKANITNEHSTEQGFNLTEYLDLLIPGGLDAQVYTAPPLKDDDKAFNVYASLKETYKNSCKPELVQELYDYAAERFEIEKQWENTHPRYQWHLHDSLYWQAEMQHWQQILNSGNTSRPGDGSSAIHP